MSTTVKKAAKKTAAKKTPAKKPKAEAHAAHECKVGDIVSFTGYEAPLEEGQEPLLSEGERLKVTEVKDDGGLVCVVLGEDGRPVPGRQGDTVFPEEVRPAEPVDSAPRHRPRPAQAEAEAEAAPEATEPVQSVGQNTAGEGGIDHDPVVQQIIDGTDDVAHKVECMAEERDRNDFAMAGLLYHVRANKDLIPKDFHGEKDPFAAWAEAHPRFKRSKAHAWASIYEAFRQVGWGADEFESVGWAKAAKLCGVDAEALKRNKAWLLDLAQESSVKGLVEGMRKRGLIVGGEEVDEVTFVFKLVASEAEQAQRAIEHAMSLIEAENEKAKPSRAFQWIVGEWLSHNERVDQPVADLVAPAVRRHGLSAVRDHVNSLADEAESNQDGDHAHSDGQDESDQAAE